MIDAKLCIEPEWSMDGLLNGLLLHEYIDLYKFSDEGPPASLSRIESDMPGEFVNGWVVLGDKHPAYMTQDLYWADGSGVSAGGVYGNAVDVARADTGSMAYSALDPERAAAHRYKDAVAAEAADAIEADLFITRRKYLHGVNWSLGRGVTFLHPEAALPLVSLYLRTQGEFLIWNGQRSSSRFNRGLFYWVGTRELLPAGWRWFSACVQHGQATGDEQLLFTGQAALQRVDRVLELRDSLHRSLNRPQDNDVADDALMAFDSALVFLMGAFDATARVAHKALDLGPRSREAGWQRAGWLKAVGKIDTALQAALSPGTAGFAVLNILTTLRNTVHSAGLIPVGVSTAMNYRERTMVNLSSGVSSDDMQDMLASMDVLGGRAVWMLEERLPGRYLADPGVLLEQLLPPAIELLNELMRLTPVEALEGTTAEVLRSAGPDAAEGTFSEKKRQSIRWQLGI